MGAIPIIRHSLIKGNINPYDPQWESYTKNRVTKLMKNTMTDMVYRLWIKENGKCKYCNHDIDEVTKWNIHHKLPRHKGGSNTLNNLVPLHPECHRQLHSRYVAGLPIQSNLIYACAVCGESRTHSS
ncbi:HNH endonuclease [Candidatus Rickettsia colombianensi]|uniref:HNH endonuclease n=1 Tax=Candidatus Rickettsia colombianensi TaxID=1090944 RepID=UPI000EF2661D|nr:HNH endonuclease signature motif containing protein [Candidatus Rickettsia colombianensi]